MHSLVIVYAFSEANIKVTDYVNINLQPIR